MSGTPQVSVIVPTQGIRDSLDAALASLRRQEFRDFEIVVVDDSATSGTRWRASPALAVHLGDPRVRVVDFHQGRGCAAAKNAGWIAARGEWICYLDDDNTCQPGRIGAQLSLARRTGSPVVLCGFTVVAGLRRRTKQVHSCAFSDDDLLLETHADTNVIFHRRDLPVKWDEEIGTVDDACLFHSIVRISRLRCVPNVPEPLVTYFAHPGPRANRDWRRFYRGQRRLLVRWTSGFSRHARRVLLLRSLVSFGKFEAGCKFRALRYSSALVRVGGWREVRVVLNVIGSRIPGLRRWMVT